MNGNGASGYIVRRWCDHCRHRTEHWQRWLTSLFVQCLACERWRTLR